MTSRANTLCLRRNQLPDAESVALVLTLESSIVLSKAGKAVSMHHNKAPPLYHVLHLYINAGFVDVTNDKSHASNA